MRRNRSCGWLARRAGLGQLSAGYLASAGLCAVSGLLVSPISWTHHRVMAVPAMLLAAVAVWRDRRRAPRRAAAWLAAIGALAVFCWSGLARNQPRLPQAAALHLPVFWRLVSPVLTVPGGGAVRATLPGLPKPQPGQP